MANLKNIFGENEKLKFDTRRETITLSGSNSRNFVLNVSKEGVTVQWFSVHERRGCLEKTDIGFTERKLRLISVQAQQPVFTKVLFHQEFEL